MAAKKVLGNDPFKRGAAPRVPLAARPSLKTAGARPQTPELQTPPPKKATRRDATPPSPAAHASAPTLAADPIPHAGVPVAVPLGRGPAAHPGSPVLAVDPIRHEATPEAFSLGAAPARHRHSPFLSADPVAHPDAPVGLSLSGARASSFTPVAHGNAPSALPLEVALPHAHSPGLRVDPVAHADAPVAQPLSGAVPHAHSPGLRVDPVAHADAPEARPFSHARSPSVRVDPVGHADTPEPRPLSHARSPSVRVDPVGHADTPEVQPVLRAHSPNLGADPIPHAGVPLSVPLAEGQPPARALTEAEAPCDDANSTDARAPITPRRHGPTPLLSRAGAVASLQGLTGAVRALLGASGKDTRVDAFGRDEALVASLQPLADALYDRYWRVTVAGANLVPSGASILVANHAGALPIDGPLLHHALRRQRADLKPARWLLEDQLFHAPGLGVLWNRLGAVRASPENAMQLLEEQTPVVVFPEGIQGLSKPFSERYQLQRFGRGGYVKIAARAGVPIVPVAIVGAEESVPLLARLPGSALGVSFLPLTLPPLPARWFIQFGSPIRVEGGAEAAGDLAFVQRLNEQVRDTIDVMLKDLLSRRDGIF
ncbi:MAG: 1-acyl-sn-glycerol-3-phosphate acyltransferase [Myxococcus sp.]|nr:1-acyl-sn-glycerol-3-phosphate acyltransferase [Myxococcus sp.]